MCASFSLYSSPGSSVHFWVVQQTVLDPHWDRSSSSTLYHHFHRVRYSLRLSNHRQLTELHTLNPEFVRKNSLNDRSIESRFSPFLLSVQSFCFVAARKLSVSLSLSRPSWGRLCNYRRMMHTDWDTHNSDWLTEKKKSILRMREMSNSQKLKSEPEQTKGRPEKRMEQ